MVAGESVVLDRTVVNIAFVSGGIVRGTRESSAKSCEAVMKMRRRCFKFSGPFTARNALSHAQKKPPAIQAIVTTVTVTDVRQLLWMP